METVYQVSKTQDRFDALLLSTKLTPRLGGTAKTKTQVEVRERRVEDVAKRHSNVSRSAVPTPTASHTARATGGSPWVHCRWATVVI